MDIQKVIPILVPAPLDPEPCFSVIVDNTMDSFLVLSSFNILSSMLLISFSS